MLRSERRNPPGLHPGLFFNFVSARSTCSDFGFLDEFTIYQQHQSSCSLNDAGRPTIIYALRAVAGAAEGRLPLRAASSSRGSPSPMGGGVVQVMPRWDGGRGVWAPTSAQGSQCGVLAFCRRCWVVGAPYEEMEVVDVDGAGGSWRARSRTGCGKCRRHRADACEPIREAGGRGD